MIAFWMEYELFKYLRMPFELINITASVKYNISWVPKFDLTFSLFLLQKMF